MILELKYWMAWNNDKVKWNLYIFHNTDLNTSDIFINKTFLLKLIWKGYENVLINIYTIIIKKCRNWNLFSYDFLIFLTNNIIVCHVNYAKNAKCKNFSKNAIAFLMQKSTSKMQNYANAWVWTL